MTNKRPVERFTAVVVGGGQAGLAVGQQLSQRGIDFVVLDAGKRVGDSWRARWDSLRLFTPARHDSLPGLRFPAAAMDFPTKDEFASYLESYAEHFALPVRLDARVSSVKRDESGYVVEYNGQHIAAEHVVVATGAYQTHSMPAFARDVAPHIKQLHAGEYHNAQQLQDGAVLVVGAGNSGAEIAIEAAANGHASWLAGRGTGEVPAVAYAFGGRLFWFLANHVLNVGTPIGRRARPRMVSHGGPLIRLRMRDVVAAGVERVPRVVSVRDGRPVLEDSRVLDVANIVWCTGFGHDFDWIHLPVFGSDGAPVHDRGVVRSEPGLYFVGLPFLSKLASAFIGGVGGDARHVVDMIAARLAHPGAGATQSAIAPADELEIGSARHGEGSTERDRRLA